MSLFLKANFDFILFTVKEIGGSECAWIKSILERHTGEDDLGELLEQACGDVSRDGHEIAGGLFEEI